MSERPVLFSGPMVRSILSGAKTRTRRVMKPQPELKGGTMLSPTRQRVITAYWHWKDEWWWSDPQPSTIAKCPYGIAGDSLWLRETWSYITKAKNEYYDQMRPDGCPVEMLYRADGYEIPANWSPSIHMPRWASRITLEVTGVRVERVQDISEYDAEQEGIKVSHYYCDEGTDLDPTPIHRCDPVGKFRELWDSLNANRGFGWDANPWVWVVEFKRIDADSGLRP